MCHSSLTFAASVNRYLTTVTLCSVNKLWVSAPFCFLLQARGSDWGGACVQCAAAQQQVRPTAASRHSENTHCNGLARMNVCVIENIPSSVLERTSLGQ